jgi:dinuclear metal center YbgI/SA1388 family protein
MPSKRVAGRPAVRAVADFLDRELRTARVSDSALNGLQVEGRRPVRVVAVAVDASLATFQAAVRAKADLLLVHHGLFWGQSAPLTGGLYARVRILIESGIGLYASHLPLDRHPRLGNNALLARRLGLTGLRPCGEYHGQTIGWGGRLPRPLPLSGLGQRLAQVLGKPPKILSFGPTRVRRAAVVSGGGGDMALAAAAEGYDAFVTGEISHTHYHPCREAGINLLLGGHYATETFGVQALASLLSKAFGTKTIFLDIPTGL